MEVKADMQIKMQFRIGVNKDWWRLTVVPGCHFRAKESLEAKGKGEVCKLGNAAAQKLNKPSSVV